jgi:hypothetical protein
MKKVFKYISKDGELIGYHCSTMCDISDDIKHAKVYTLTTEEDTIVQSQIILHNFVYFVNHKATNPRYFKNYIVSSIYVVPEIVD